MTKVVPLTIPNLITAMKQAGFVTNESLDKRLNGSATKDDLKNFATKDDLKNFATKDDLKGFATKDDLKNFATKDDLKGFATKDDLKSGLKGLRKQINNDQFEARAEFYQKMTKPAIEQVETNLSAEISRLDSKIDKVSDKLSSEISSLKNDLNGLNAEFSSHHHSPILKN